MVNSLPINPDHSVHWLDQRTVTTVSLTTRLGILVTAICACIWILGIVIGFGPAVSLLTTVGIASCLLGFMRPVMGAYGVAILCTLDAITRVFVLTGGLFRWNTINYLMLVAIAVGIPTLIRRGDSISRVLLIFIGFLGYNLLGSKDIEAGIQHILAAVSYFGLLVYLLRGTNKRETWHWIAIISNTVAALGGLVYFLQVDNLPKMNANAWAHFPLSALFSVCCASAVPENTPRRRSLLWGLFIVNFVWVVLTGSRGGITIALCCLWYMICRIVGLSRRMMFLASMAILGSLVANQFGERQEYVMHRLDKSVSTEYSLSSRTSGRSDLAIGGWRMFQEHLITGVGTGGFAVAWKNLTNRYGLGNYAMNRESEAHSGWVKTFAEGGIVGIVLHVAFVLSIWRAGAATRMRPLRQLGLLATLTLSVGFLSTEFQGKSLWYLTACSAVIIQQEFRYRKRAKQASQSNSHA
jgi:O-antigen ligase